MPVTISTLSIFLICDILPICCILFYHSRNFKTIKFKSLSSAGHETLRVSNVSSLDTKTTKIAMSVVSSAKESPRSLNQSQDENQGKLTDEESIRSSVFAENRKKTQSAKFSHANRNAVLSTTQRSQENSASQLLLSTKEHPLRFSNI